MKLNFNYVWLALFMIAYVFATSGETHLLPNVGNVATGFKVLFTELQLGTHLLHSIKLCLISVVMATAFSLIIAYMSPFAKLKGLSKIMSQCRYLPLIGFSFYAATLFDSARHIQIFILVFFMSTYLVTSLLSMIEDIEDAEWDHAKTLGLTKWQCVKEIIVLGRQDYVIDIIRQNMAISWMMIVAVETIMFSNGGIGVLLKNSEKFTNHGEIVALQIVILIIGLFFDYVLTFTRKLFYKYTF
jgi:NitT/TauT family transport system permease protein